MVIWAMGLLGTGLLVILRAAADVWREAAWRHSVDVLLRAASSEGRAVEVRIDGQRRTLVMTGQAAPPADPMDPMR
jgi:hypothetical protein